jgi:hypothetical protein
MHRIRLRPQLSAAHERLPRDGKVRSAPTSPGRSATTRGGWPLDEVTVTRQTTGDATRARPTYAPLANNEADPRRGGLILLQFLERTSACT